MNNNNKDVLSEVGRITIRDLDYSTLEKGLCSWEMVYQHRRKVCALWRWFKQAFINPKCPSEKVYTHNCFVCQILY